MSKQRIIKDEIWDDEWFFDLTTEQKLVWMFLLTNPRNNVAGVYRINLRWAALQTGLTPDALKSVLDSFVADGKIKLHNGWVVLVNFHRHQSKNPKIEAGVARILADLPIEIAYLLPMDSLCIAYPTLLNLTLPIGTGLHPDPSKPMAWKKYNEDGHYEEPAIDADTGSPLADEEATQTAARRELDAKIRHNLKLIEDARGLPFGKGRDMAYHVKIYRELLEVGWSHQAIVQEFLTLTESEHWQKERATGKYPGLNTVQFSLRNRKPV